MRILEAALTVSHVSRCAHWFATTLELPVTRRDERAEVTLGRSLLVLETGPPSTGRHHLAFSVRPEDFEAVLAFARSALDVIRAGDSDVVDGAEGWDSRSVYFRGPEGLVLEYIAREAHRGRHPAGDATGAPAVLSLNEVGIGVADVPDAVDRLSRWPDLPAYPPQTADFAPVGDPDGLLVLATPDRTWFPTDHDRPSTGPLTVTVAGTGTGSHEGELRIGEHTTVRQHRRWPLS